MATPPNNSFKPDLLRDGNNMAGKACLVVASATSRLNSGVRPPCMFTRSIMSLGKLLPPNGEHRNERT